MLRKALFAITSVLSFYAVSQQVEISGIVLDANQSPLSFVTVSVFDENDSEVLKGATTDETGWFNIAVSSDRNYRFEFRFIGYHTQTIEVTANQSRGLGIIVLEEQTENLEETVIYSQRPAIRKEPGKLVFTVENTSLSTGNTLNLLSRTPGVSLVQGNISVKSKSPVIYINNRRVYLSTSEITSLLTSMDAGNIKAIEVITNPSSKYDAEGSVVLNILTTRPVSVGYKGSVSATYEQAVYPKYAFGSTHFYKNKWLSLLGSYTISPRKEFKDQRGFIRFFEPEGGVNSIWTSDFNRTTTSLAHQGNLVADITLGENHELTLASNILVSPDTEYQNDIFTEIRNAQQQLDSTFRTQSTLMDDKSNLSFSASHVFNSERTKFESGINFIRYRDDQFQQVDTRYFEPSGDLIRNNEFFTQANQESDIITGNVQLTSSLFDGSFALGGKYSHIDTRSSLDFFNQMNNNPIFNEALSDEFLYEEAIYAGFLSYDAKWESWALEIGLRGEYTDILGDSRALGTVNSQNYFEWFPSLSLQYRIDEKHTTGFNYARRITRPRYQSLNPFKYFLNENNFNAGNPNLVPAIDNKYTLSYSFKDLLFIDLYYHHTENVLSILTFQDNQTRVIRNIDANLIKDFQYSLDLTYSNSFSDWCFLSLYSSGFYFENEFYAIESTPETYTNSVFGFYGQIYSGITLAKDTGLSSDITAEYLSKYIYGSYVYNNQFNLSISFKKSFWEDRASITAGVDDIFNTYNVPITSKYYNQDNSYFPMPESRLFRLGLKFAFGNAVLRDRSRTVRTSEQERLDSNN